MPRIVARNRPWISRAVSFFAPGGHEGYVSVFLASRILSASTSAILAIVAFAVAGPARVGEFAALAAICAFAGAMGGGWLSQAILRFHQMSDVSTPTLFRLVPTRGFFFSAAILSSAGLITAGLTMADDHVNFSVAILTTVFSSGFALLSIQQGTAMAQHHGGRVVVNELGRASSLTLPPLLATTTWQGSTDSFGARCLIIGLTLHALALLGGYLLGARRSLSLTNTRGRASLPDPLTIFKYGSPLAVWIGLAAVYQTSDRVLLAWLASDQAAGEYTIIYDIASRGLLLPVTALSGAASSAILRSYNRGEHQSATLVNRTIVRVQCILILATSLFVIGGAAIATQILEWFNVEHAAVAIVTFFAAGIWTLSDTIQRERLGARDTGPLVKWIAYVALGGVVANIIFIPFFGMIAAAVVTFFSSSTYAMLVLRNGPIHATDHSSSDEDA